MHFAYAVTIIIACPLVLRVVDSRVRRFHAVVRAIFVGVDDCAVDGNRLGNDAFTGVASRVRDDPATLFTGVAADDVNNGRAVVGEGAVTPTLICAATCWVERVAMGFAFFPPH